jgi:prefoldin beta subunit
MNDISPQLQNQIAQFQQLQQQLQNVSTQKMQMEAQVRELKRTLAELDKTDEEAPIYKSVGALLIKTSDRSALKEEMEESVETMDIRIKALERQEKSLREKFQSLQETLNKAMGAPRAN